MSLDKNIKYVHHKEAHNPEAPSIIVPVIMDLLKPSSVVDVGCGIGTFLAEFQKQGVQDIRGYDGHWVNREQLIEYIEDRYFVEADLEKEIETDRQFDLAICLEVAEHLKESSAFTLVRTLTSFSDTILFSASIPGQMGQNHVNEQWPAYWRDKFQVDGYSLHDVIRPIFWNDERLPRWYQQNMLLFVKKEKGNATVNSLARVPGNMINLTHPNYFKMRLRQLQQAIDNSDAYRNKYLNLMKGKENTFLYLKLIIKSMINVLKKNKE